MSDQAAPVTIRDVAAACGVSHTMVSRALRNHAGVASTTREKILRAATEMGYRANPMMSLLLSQVRQARPVARTSALAWINTNPVEDWWRISDFDRPLLEGAKSRADELGFALNEFWVHEGGYTPAQLHRVLRARSISGLVVPNVQPYGLAALEGMPWADYAVALIGWAWPDSPLSRAAADFHGNIGIALQRLQAAGVRRIGLFAQRGLNVFVSNHLLLGHYYSYSMGLRAKDRVPVLAPDRHLPACEGEVAAWLERHAPEVVLTHDARLLPAIRKTGRKVPDDIGVVHLSIAPDVGDWAGVDADLPMVAGSAVDLVYGQLSRREFGPPRVPKVVTTRGQWSAGKTWRDPLASPSRGGVVVKG